MHASELGLVLAVEDALDGAEHDGEAANDDLGLEGVGMTGLGVLHRRNDGSAKKESDWKR